MAADEKNWTATRLVGVQNASAHKTNFILVTSMVIAWNVTCQLTSTGNSADELKNLIEYQNNLTSSKKAQANN